MVRIKGTNSDYVYTGNPQELIKEQKDADPLYLKIFICPYDMPSRVEPNNGEVCEGTDEECPQGENSAGHALICLHEKEGISLVTNNQIEAKGTFVVKPEKGKELLKVGQEGITVQGAIDMNGALSVNHHESPRGKELVLEVSENTSLVIKTKGGKDVLFEFSAQGISMQVTNGSKIEINSQGDIELSPSNTGKVKINGNLEVTGDVTVAGQKLPNSSEAINHV
jgi:hypothetical protein